MPLSPDQLGVVIAGIHLGGNVPVLGLATLIDIGGGHRCRVVALMLLVLLLLVPLQQLLVTLFLLVLEPRYVRKVSILIIDLSKRRSS